MSASPLRLVDTQTGELVHQDERDLLIEELERQKRGLTLQNGKLRAENTRLRSVEPNHEEIREVLHYWRDTCKPNATSIGPEGERWLKVRARFQDTLEGRHSWTKDELKLAVDGALLDPWLNGTAPKAPKDGRFLDAKTIFKSPEQVERLIDLALGFKGQTGAHLRDVLEVADRLRVVSWKHLTRTCECGHLRLEHAAGDPHHEGRERCFMCSCPDFFQDVFEAMGEL